MKPTHENVLPTPLIENPTFQLIGGHTSTWLSLLSHLEAAESILATYQCT